MSGQRWHWRGRRQGRTLVEIETLWTVGGEYPPSWPTPQDGWTLTLEGDPSFRTHFLGLASFERAEPIAEHVRAASIATAMAAVNAIPHVVAAPPGWPPWPTCPSSAAAFGFGTRVLSPSPPGTAALRALARDHCSLPGGHVRELQH